MSIILNATGAGACVGTVIEAVLRPLGGSCVTGETDPRGELPYVLPMRRGGTSKDCVLPLPPLEVVTFHDGELGIVP